VHPASGLATYSHLENEYLQGAVDRGVLGALALGFAAIWLAVIAVKRWRDGPLAAGALGALTVVAIHPEQRRLRHRVLGARRTDPPSLQHSSTCHFASYRAWVSCVRCAPRT
jgi:hypothetical protein